jgi:hypothetical protein
MQKKVETLITKRELYSAFLIFVHMNYHYPYKYLFIFIEMVNTRVNDLCLNYVLEILVFFFIALCAYLKEIDE